MTKKIDVPTHVSTNRLEAENIKEYLITCATVDKFVSVKQYAMITSAMDWNWADDHGWDLNVLSKVRIKRNVVGYYLDLPEPILFKKEEL